MYHGQDVVGSFPVRLAILEQPGTDRPVYQHSFADRTGLDAYHVDIVHPGNTQQLLVSIYCKDFAGDDVQRQCNAVTDVDVKDGKLNLDALNLAQKVYNMLNRIAISGGSYKDWIETVYTTDYYFRAETPLIS